MGVEEGFVFEVSPKTRGRIQRLTLKLARTE